MRNELHEIANKLQIDLAEIEGAAVLILPENADRAQSREELHDAEGSLYLAKKFRENGIPCKTGFDLGLRPRVLERRGAEIWLGMIWLFAEHAMFPMATSVLSTWISDRFSGGKKAEDVAIVHVELRTQRKRNVSTITIDGPVNDVLAVIAALQNSETSTRND